MAVALISHPECLRHDMNHALPEVSMRLEVIERAIIESGLVSLLKSYLAPPATKKHLLRVHEEDYVDYVFLSSPAQGMVPLDPDTWMNPHTLNAALHAAGAAILGVDLVMSGEVRAAFCNVRPPGHHAEKATAMGFCFFNNIAIGVAHALSQHALSRIAIVDFDAHHGNGIENIFLHDKRVLYCSSFEHPFYPFSGADTVSDHIINIPISAGSDGATLKKLVKEKWLKALSDFRPEMLFFAAGFDAYCLDVMSDLQFKEDDFAWITREILDVTNASTHGRVVSSLEGGYALQGLGGCVVAHLREILQNTF